jgi:DNA-binding response OmpR family regulator
MLSDTFLAGDDQYFVEPFDPVTFTSRVASITDSAHSTTAARGSTMSFGDLTIDFDACTVTKRGSRVRLSPKEYDLLLNLIQRRGTIVPRDALLRDVWGYGPGIATRTVDAHVAELRRKLETVPSEPRHLLTVRKRGYRFVV